LRGESLEALSREINVRRIGCRNGAALRAAAGALKERERDARDDAIERLKEKVGEITMANELVHATIERLETGRPVAGRGSRR
jgi:transposase